MKLLLAAAVAVGSVLVSKAVDPVNWFAEDATSVTTALGAEGKSPDGQWTNLGDQVSVAEGKVLFDADEETPVTYAPDAALDGDTAAVTISGVSFTVARELATVSLDGVQAAVSIATNAEGACFFAYADGGTWRLSSVEADPTQTYDIVCTLTYPKQGDNTVKYEIKDGDVIADAAVNPITDKRVSRAQFLGNGELTSLAGQYLPKEFVVSFANGTGVTAAKVNGEDYPGTNLTYVAGTEVTVTYAADATHCFPNGALTMDKTITVSADGAIAVPDDVVAADAHFAIAGAGRYVTIAEALAAAKGTDADAAAEIDFIDKDAALELAGFGVDENAFAGKGLVIDLNGCSVSFTSGYSTSKQGVRVFKGNDVTFRNGAMRSTFEGATDVVRSYAKNLTFDSVTLDGSQMTTGYMIIWTNGSLAFTGSSSVIAPEGKLILDGGNYAGADYEMGTLTFDTTGQMKGNLALAGGAIDVQAIGTDDIGTVTFGAKMYTAWSDADDLNGYFAARVGALLEPTGTGDEPTGGRLYKAAAAAVAALQGADAGKEAKFFKGLTLVEELTLTGKLTVVGTLTGAENITLDETGSLVTAAADLADTLKKVGTAVAVAGPDAENLYTYTSVDAEASYLAGTTWVPCGTVSNALEQVPAGGTVKFLKNVAYENKLAKQTTKAAVVDFNGHAVAIDGAIVCTADTDFVIKNGDYVQPKAGSGGDDAKYCFAVTAGHDLTFSNMIFHGTVQILKNGAARDVTIVDCTFKDDLQTNGEPRAESGNTFVSYCVNVYPNCCARCFVVGNTFYQKRRAAIATDGADNVVYVYKNKFYGQRDNNTDSESGYKFPTIQGNDFAEIYYEENILSGEFVQGCVTVCKSSSKLIVRGNTFDSTQNYIWTMKNNGITPTVYFDGNVYENPNINKTRGCYKIETTYDNYPANVDGNELSLPEAYDSFYAWAKSEDDGKVFVKDAFAADLSAAVVGDQVIAQPFAALTGLGTGLALQNAAGKVNGYTVIDKPTAVTFTVNFDANIKAATYSVDGAEAQAIADGGTIADVAPGSVVTFAVTETTKEGCMVAATATGNVTQDGLAFTVAQDLTNPAVTINLTATQAFALAIPLESGETVKCATPADAWLYATNGTHYVKFLQTIKTSTMVLNVMSGDTALIDLNGCDSLYRAKSGYMTVADVEGKPYKAYTAYANLAAAWAAGKSAVKYRFSVTVDASAITLGADGAVLEGEFSINTENKVEGGFKENTEPKLGENYEKTTDWGMIDRAAFKFAAAATSTDPVPPPAEDTPEAVAAALSAKGITATDVTSKADLVALNAMLTAAGVTDAATLSEGAKAALNSSFLMKDIAAGKIFEAEPTITIEKIEATETAGTFEFTVAVKEGATLVQLQQAGAEALAGKVLVGNTVDAISSKVKAEDLTVKSVADGKAVFDIAYGDGEAGFMKINVTK